VWFIPVHSIAVESIGLTAGPAVNYALFTFTFASAAGLATWLHRSSLTPSVVLAVAMVVGAAQAAVSSNHVGPIGVVASVVLMLLLGARVVTMSLRDWRNPVAEAFGLGAAILLAELIVTAQGHGVDRGLLALMVAQFFLFSMASRAASIRIATPIGQVRGAGRRLRVAGLSVAVLGASLGAAVALGGKHGLLRGLGRLVLAVILPVLGFLALIVARVLLVPLDWIFGKLNIDLSGVRNAMTRLLVRGQPQEAGGTPWVLRLVGLAALVLVAIVLVRIVTRLWAPEEDVGEAEEPELPAMPVVRRSRRRRKPRAPRLELPADTVRRWYAEALLALERTGIPKPPSWTPAEYLVEVRRSIPECGAGFAALTRSYEEVRYGNRTYGKDALKVLEPHRVDVMAILQGAGRPR